jgi:hypothetical protein
MAASSRNAALAAELRTLLTWPPPPPPGEWQTWLVDSHVIHDRAAFLVVRKAAHARARRGAAETRVFANAARARARAP